MRQRFLGQVDAAQHARHLFDPLAFAQARHRRMGRIAIAHLVHEQVMVALRGYLRQVGDRQYLPTLAQATQQLPHDFSSRAADTHVDFVEHQGRNARGLSGNDLDRQADP